MVFYHASTGGVTLTGGEPLYQKEFCTGILRACKNESINTAIETSLYCERDTLKTLLELVYLFIVDIKIFDPTLHQKYTGKTNSIIMENLRFLSERNINILVRVPLIKGITDYESNLLKISELASNLNLPGPVEFLTYNPLAGSKYQKLGIPFLIKQ